MDHELTKKMRAWLETPEEQRDLEEGALLVLQLSNNRIMYQGFMRNLKRSAKMIAYQLQKYYNFRVKDLTHQEVAEMTAQVRKIAEKDNLQAIPTSSENESKAAGDNPSPELVAAIRKGRRVDHDALPEDIQALYIENLHIIQRMRNLHAKLELLSVEHATCPDSERYPFLKELIALDKQYHENWNIYDHYVLSGAPAPVEVKSDDEATSLPEQDAQALPDETRSASEPAVSEKVPATSEPEPAPAPAAPKKKNKRKSTTSKKA